MCHVVECLERFRTQTISHQLFLWLMCKLPNHIHMVIIMEQIKGDIMFPMLCLHSKRRWPFIRMKKAFFITRVNIIAFNKDRIIKMLNDFRCSLLIKRTTLKSNICLLTCYFSMYGVAAKRRSTTPEGKEVTSSFKRLNTTSEITTQTNLIISNKHLYHFLYEPS